MGKPAAQPAMEAVDEDVLGSPRHADIAESALSSPHSSQELPAGLKLLDSAMPDGRLAGSSSAEREVSGSIKKQVGS